MDSKAPYTEASIKRFTTTLLQPRLASDFEPYYKKRDLVRLHGNFVQLLALSGGRYGNTLKVLPTFYVAGARPWDEVIPQTVALDTLQPQSWRFQDRALDDALADEICKRLAAQSPLSFTQPLTDEDIRHALEGFAKREESEGAALFLAHFLMTSGLPDALPWLAQARKVFSKQNRPIVHGWQRATLQRIDELESRVSTPPCVALCRQEAEAHATRLKLQKIKL